MGPVSVCLLICAALTAATWIASIATREYSWVDRIWSIAPIVYVWVFAIATAFDARLVLMAALVTIWGLRLTFNFARKGGYRPGGEDYRWAVLRGRMAPWELMRIGPRGGIKRLSPADDWRIARTRISIRREEMRPDREHRVQG